jgi:predicted ABC-type transport system involved in lysophospholipase L1 biosynthesis ATPase subunit
VEDSSTSTGADRTGDGDGQAGPGEPSAGSGSSRKSTAPTLNARRTILGAVARPLELFGLADGRTRRGRAAEILRSVGLGERYLDLYPAQVSGGERQRVAIARATVLDPKLLLADEPTGNLDTTSGRHVLEILEQMNAAGLTLVVVTHDPAVARRARRILVLKDGRVVHRGDGAHIHEAVEILSAAENGA